MKSTAAGIGLLGTVLLLAAGAADAGAEIYKWVDAQGRVHFQDHPPEQGAASGAVEVTPSRKAAREPAAAPPAQIGSPLPFGTPAPAGAVVPEPQKATVELYTVGWCGWCKKAKAYFTAQGIAFTEYDIEKDAAAAARKQQLDSRPGVPFAVVNGISIHGYSVEAYERALRGKP